MADARRELQLECCELLGGLAERALHAPASLQALGHVLPQLLAGLAAAFEATSAPAEPCPDTCPGSPARGAGPGAPAALAALLTRLTAGAPPALGPFLRTAEPLPAGGPLARAAAALAAARAQLGLAEELALFAARAAAMPASQRARSAAALRAALASRGAQLLDPGPDAGHGRADGGEGSGAARAGVEAATWRLVWLSEETDDPALAALAGELLARVGPGDPFTLALPHAAARAGGPPEAPAAPAAEPGRGRARSGKAAQAADQSQQVPAAPPNAPRGSLAGWLSPAMAV